MDKGNIYYLIKLKLQELYRAKKTAKVERGRYLDKMNHWRNSQDAIIKIQSFWRAKLAAKAYKALCNLRINLVFRLCQRRRN